MRIALSLCLLLVACDSDRTGSRDATGGPEVTVFSASSLTELVTELSDGWSKRTGRAVRLQFEASSTLARQIKEGAPADVFVTAAPEWLDRIPLLSRYDWLSNRLVCVVRKDRKELDLRTIESLALADPQVPAGAYALAALSHLGISLPARTIYGSNVRDVLSKVSQGGAAAGIVYGTDAAIDPEVRIAYTFPEGSHPKILYSVGVLSENGSEFAAMVREPAAIEAARRHGFNELK